MKEQKTNINQQKEAIAQLRLMAENGIKIPDDDWQELARTITFKTAGKNTVIHQAGKIETCGRFIVKGALKITFHGDEESYIYDLKEKNDYLCDANSIMNKIKSPFTFETITECEWIECDIYKAVQLNEKIASSFSRIVMEHLSRGYKRTEFLRINNAEDRYSKYCKKHSYIARNAKLGDIASYLDLTPQSLSRIRKNLGRA